MDMLNLMAGHRSVRNYTDKPVPYDLLEELVAAARCAATSHHVQAYTLIRVKDKSLRQQIAHLAGPQAWVAEAPVFLVFCADLTRLVHACAHHDIEPETGWAEQLLVAVADTAILGQNLMLAAESKGLGGVFIGGIRNDPAKVCDLLNIPDLAFPVFGMCLGYPAGEPGIKPRLPVSAILHTDRFPGNPPETDLAAYDRTTEAYYLNRAPRLKDQAWRKRMAQFTGQVIRPHMKSFLEKKGFFLK